MSRFFAEKYSSLKAYVPGEQPRERKFIKLNTNENPFPPVKAVGEAVREAAGRLQLYSDTESTLLKAKMAEILGLSPENLLMTNGSDEALNFAFMAFCDENRPAVFPDITYGFYPVFAQINRAPFRTVPLAEDWTVRPEDYRQAGGPVFIANPNAPTGVFLPLPQVEEILRSNPDQVVTVDEAYVDFGGESAVSLLNRYENLLVIGTFSKSRSMAGLRLGFAAGSAELIRDLKTMQYSTNPYNVDSLAQAAGLACLNEDGYNRENARIICETRAWTRSALEDLGFTSTDSRANFLFASHPAFPAGKLQKKLRERGILIRWFDQERIRDWYRISIGAREDMETMIGAIRELLEEEK